MLRRVVPSAALRRAAASVALGGAMLAAGAEVSSCAEQPKKQSSAPPVLTLKPIPSYLPSPIREPVLAVADVLTQPLGWIATWVEKDRLQRITYRTESRVLDTEAANEGSGTAKLTMYRRFVADGIGLEAGDTMASRFLPAFWASEVPWYLERLGWGCLWLRYQLCGRVETGERHPKLSPMLEGKVPTQGGFDFNYFYARTRFLDDAVTGLAPELDQIVVLGAGYDTRFYRLDAISPSGRIKCFEVDAPNTQAAKLKYLKQGGVDAKHVNFVPCDFAHEDWLETLEKKGFDRSKRTLFVWEGVAYYLTDDVIAGTLANV